MFNFFKKKDNLSLGARDQSLQKIVEQSEILVVTKGGGIYLTSTSLDNKPKDHQDGRILEVMITLKGMKPCFVYYLNEEYYYAMQSNSWDWSKAKAFRVAVSEYLTQVLIALIYDNEGLDLSGPSTWNHNRINTNTIIYVESLEQWYPIRDAASGNWLLDDGAATREVERINSGEAAVADFISIYDLSPA